MRIAKRLRSGNNGISLLINLLILKNDMHLVKLLLLFLSISLPMNGNEYFVDVKGNDSNAGTRSSPFASIFRATEMACAGDTVTINGGVYQLYKQFKPLRSGSPSKWILYRSAPNEKAVFDGSFITKTIEKQTDSVSFARTTQGVFQIAHVNYIRFERIEVRNSKAAGFIVRGPNCKKITLDGCKSENSHNSGIGLWYCDSTLVTNCEITGANNNVTNAHNRKEAPHEALTVAGATNFEVSHNHIHHCFKEGVDCKEVSRHGIVHHNLVHDVPRQAYYADAWFGVLEDIEFHSNVAYNSFWGFAISVEGEKSELRNVRIHHNLVYNIIGSGIHFGMWGKNLLRSDIHIYNNTFYRCGTDSVYSGGVGSIDIHSQNFRDVYIYRNICDKGWNYEMGFSFPLKNIKNTLKSRNFVAAENLFEGIKNKPAGKGQYDVIMQEYLPSKNQLGTAVFRHVEANDFIPVKIPAVKNTGIHWKYKPSPWFGAYEPAGNN